MTAANLLQSHPFVLSHGSGVTLAEWAGLGQTLHVDLAVTTREGGISIGPYESLNLAFHVGDDPDAVRENRARAARRFRCGADDLVFAEQVHGNTVAAVGRGDRGRGAFRVDDAIPGADALLTDDPELVLVTMVADCVPVALVDPVAGLLATVHAGWRGTLNGVAEATIDALEARGARRSRMVAVLGPAVGPDRYQVGAEVAEAAHHRLGQASERVLRPDGPGHWQFDLSGALQRVLTGAGLVADNVMACPRTTGPGTPFFSDREARPCGRFALLARLRPYDGQAHPAT